MKVQAHDESNVNAATTPRGASSGNASMGGSRAAGRPVDLMTLATLVLWIGCLAIGLGGRVLHYPWPHAPTKEPAPMLAKMLNVQISDVRAPPVQGDGGANPSSLSQSPPKPAATVLPSAPPLPAVAAPSPAIAFAVPVEGPTRIVEPLRADFGRPPSTAAATQSNRTPHAESAPAAPRADAASADTPQQLTFGQGEGNQPSPEYPREAQIARQEGNVIVRFTVDADGEVKSAYARVPCPFPLLNQAAVRAVRDTWTFPRGPVRLYEVKIQFQLLQR